MTKENFIIILQEQRGFSSEKGFFSVYKKNLLLLLLLFFRFVDVSGTSKFQDYNIFSKFDFDTYLTELIIYCINLEKDFKENFHFLPSWRRISERNRSFSTYTKFFKKPTFRNP